MNLRTEIRLPALRGRTPRVVVSTVVAALFGGLTFLSGGGADLSFAVERDIDLWETQWHPRLRVVAFDEAYYETHPGTGLPARNDLATVLNRLADRGAQTVVLDASLTPLIAAAAAPPAGMPELVAALGRVKAVVSEVPGDRALAIDPAIRAVALPVPITRDQTMYSWAVRHPFESGKRHSLVIYGVRTVEDEDGRDVPSWPTEVLRAHARNQGRPDPTVGLPKLVRYPRVDVPLPLSAAAFLDPSGTARRTDFERNIVFITDLGESARSADSLSALLEPPSAVNAMAQGSVAYRRVGAMGVSFTTFGLALLAMLAMLFLRPLLAAVLLVVLLFGYGLWTVLQFQVLRQVPIEIPLAFFFLATALGLGLRAFSERRSKERLQSVVDEYVPPAVALALTADQRGTVATAPVEATVLYVDVRGYTTLTGELDATEVKAALDIYYSTLGPIVADYRGVLLYYAGDGMVVTFGPPEHPEGHADAALACGRAMQQARARVAYELGRHNLPELSYGIGLDTGSVVIGPVGSAHLRQYTVLGEAVNIASRMCAIATEGQVCLTESTRVRLRDAPPLVDMGELQLKNVLREIQGWRIADDAVVVPT